MFLKNSSKYKQCKSILILTMCKKKINVTFWSIICIRYVFFSHYNYDLTIILICIYLVNETSLQNKQKNRLSVCWFDQFMEKKVVSHHVWHPSGRRLINLASAFVSIAINEFLPSFRYSRTMLIIQIVDGVKEKYAHRLQKNKT